MDLVGADGVGSDLQAVQYEVRRTFEQQRVLAAGGFTLAAVAHDDRRPDTRGYGTHLAPRGESRATAADQTACVDLGQGRGRGERGQGPVPAQVFLQVGRRRTDQAGWRDCRGDHRVLPMLASGPGRLVVASRTTPAGRRGRG